MLAEISLSTISLRNRDARLHYWFLWKTRAVAPSYLPVQYGGISYRTPEPAYLKAPGSSALETRLRKVYTQTCGESSEATGVSLYYGPQYEYADHFVRCNQKFGGQSRNHRVTTEVAGTLLRESDTQNGSPVVS